MDLRELNAQAARRDRLSAEVAAFTGLSIAAVRGRLSRAHGRTLLRNLFADAWPTELRPQPAMPVAVAKPLTPARVPPPRPPSAGPERTIHRVRQQFTTSCGVAVVAMFARVSHAEAMAVMFPQPAKVFYTHLHQVKRGLDHFGITYGPGWKRCRGWDDIPTTALVRAKWEANGRKGSHWVIFQRRRDGSGAVIDPDRGRYGTQRLSRPEMDEYKPVTYLPVEARLPRGVR